MSVNKANRIGGLTDADAQEEGQGDRDDEELDAWRTATRHAPSHANTRAVSSCREQSKANPDLPSSHRVIFWTDRRFGIKQIGRSIVS